MASCRRRYAIEAPKILHWGSFDIRENRNYAQSPQFRWILEGSKTLQTLIRSCSSSENLRDSLVGVKSGIVVKVISDSPFLFSFYVYETIFGIDLVLLLETLRRSVPSVPTASSKTRKSVAMLSTFAVPRLDLRGQRICSLNGGPNMSPNLMKPMTDILLWQFVNHRDNLLSSLEGIEILKWVKQLYLAGN
ncbi:hypothetical protein L2E82_41669 [Cichorium intybus]|uniref:Uncharacterized protein n=1 Tax=Cichorium intybus TaxID=13427 RepID=A0ACB8ZLR1_CICIN|nr:hypothetical protein L2E82_41669 [Cichorium intybus]